MLENTPLYQEHTRLNAQMAPFANWNMPVQYSSIIEEHFHTRSKAGLFDICHMGEFLLMGETAEKDVDRLITCRIDDMNIGRCRYGFLLNEQGKIIDDLIAFKTSDKEIMLVVNAATTKQDKEWISAHLSKTTRFEDISGKTAKLDIQGPLSKEILSRYTDVPLDEIKKYHFKTGKLCDLFALISRTGYTGELGYELYFPAQKASDIWNKLLEHQDLKSIGLGARDILRLEMGFSLYGNDIDEGHTPLEASLEKFIHFEKDFIGKSALIEQRCRGFGQKLVGFVCNSRRSPRHNFSVLYNGKTVGKVTSASFSPWLKKSIGLCYIKIDYAFEGNRITLTDNAVSIEAIITKPPFIGMGLKNKGK